MEKFKLKQLIFFCIMSLPMINLFAQQTSTTTTVTEQKFVNPLPRDKFVGLLINEKVSYTYKDLTRYKTTTCPYYFDKYNKILLGGTTTSDIFLNPNIIIFVGVNIQFGKQELTHEYAITSLPVVIDLRKSVLASHMLAAETQHKIMDNLFLISLHTDGTVEIEYGKKRKVLLPQRKWYYKKKKIIDYNEWRKNEKIILNLEIVNYGIISKESYRVMKEKLQLQEEIKKEEKKK